MKSLLAADGGGKNKKHHNCSSTELYLYSMFLNEQVITAQKKQKIKMTKIKTTQGS